MTSSLTAPYTSLRSLLELWAHAEPQRCRLLRGLYGVNLFDEDSPCWHDVYSLNDQECAGGSSLLQGAVQASLAERDFCWCLRCQGGYYSACVWQADSREKHEVSAYSECMALLWAYLNACRVTTAGSLRA